MPEFLTKGHRTIIAFFPGAFTGVCTQEMRTFRDTYGELQKLHGGVVGISVDASFAPCRASMKPSRHCTER